MLRLSAEVRVVPLFLSDRELNIRLVGLTSYTNYFRYSNEAGNADILNRKEMFTP